VCVCFLYIRLDRSRGHTVYHLLRFLISTADGKGLLFCLMSPGGASKPQKKTRLRQISLVARLGIMLHFFGPTVFFSGLATGTSFARLTAAGVRGDCFAAIGALLELFAEEGLLADTIASCLGTAGLLATG